MRLQKRLSNLQQLPRRTQATGGDAHERRPLIGGFGAARAAGFSSRLDSSARRPLIRLMVTHTLRGAFYCIEGNKAAVVVCEIDCSSISAATPIIIKPEHKALYHAAALMASPHLVALFDLAVELMVSSGVKWADARKMLLPLVESTVKNLQARPPATALTGTFARGDIGTVERHLKVLSEGTQTSTRSPRDLQTPRPSFAATREGEWPRSEKGSSRSQKLLKGGCNNRQICVENTERVMFCVSFRIVPLRLSIHASRFTIDSSLFTFHYSLFLWNVHPATVTA